MHDTTKVLLGSTRQGGKSPAKVVSNYASSPATYKAGLAVRVASTGLLSLSSGFLAGISLGKALGDSTLTAVCRKSGGVPLRVMKYSGTATVTNYANLVDTVPDTLQVAGVTFTAQAGAATLGTATFRAATSNDATATSLAAQINAHATANTKVIAVAAAAVVHISSIEDAASAPTLVYTDASPTTVGITVTGSGALSAMTPTRGAVVYVHPSLGKAVASTYSGAVATNAVYARDGALLTGYDEDAATSCDVAMVDMEGGI